MGLRMGLVDEEDVEYYKSQGYYISGEYPEMLIHDEKKQYYEIWEKPFE